LPFAPEWGRSPITFSARPGERIEDVVLLLSPEVEYLGLVSDPEEKPVSGATVRILNSGEGETALAPLQDTFTSDAKGQFRFRAPEGAWLEASHPNFSPGRAYVGQYAQASRRVELHLSPKSDQDRSQVISGQVLDPQGAPVTGASVSATRSQRR